MRLKLNSLSWVAMQDCIILDFCTLQIPQRSNKLYRFKKSSLSCKRPWRYKCGFGVILAMFILVILASVAGFAVNMASITHGTSNLTRQGEIAYFAAKSGLEWGVYKVTSEPAACPVNTTLTLNQGVFNNFNVKVSCTKSTVIEGSKTYNIFNLSALAERGVFGNTDYISREMQVTATLGG